MGKRTWKTIDFQQVDWPAVSEQAGRVVVAIDAAKHDFVATLMDGDRAVQALFRWRHPQHTRAVVERIAGLDAPVEAVIEPTGTYGDPVRHHLQQAGVAVYRMPAKRVADAAELYDGVASLHDAKSSYVMARLHLEGVSRRWSQPDEVSQALQAWSKRLGWYRDRAQRAHSRLEAWLARHWPEAPLVLGLDRASLLELLSAYGPPSAVVADRDGARRLLTRVGGRFLEAEKVEALLDSAAATIGVPCLDAQLEEGRELAGELLAMRRACRVIERRVHEALGDEPDVACQATAIGRMSAAVLRAGLGDPRQYPNAGAYAKAGGLHLRERSSGKHVGQLRITKRGPGAVRQYLYFAVLRLLRHDGPAWRWYRAKVARDGGRTKPAITALMRKLLKALWHVGQGEVFDEHRLFGHTPAN